MCIFTHDVISVSNTRILVAPLPNGKQVTVYENTAVTPVAGNCMILPVAGNYLNIELIDLSKLFPGDSLWEQCEQFFPRENFGSGGGFSFGGGAVDVKTLPVQRVGAYLCSVAPSVDALRHADPSVFSMPENIAQILTKHYATFSFIVCKFATFKVQGHPIAYISSRLPNGTLFIPTRHEHGGGDTIRIPERVVHEGITCDGEACCHNKKSFITGTRWKCAGCPNFDLCDSCHAQNLLHDMHPFVEYKKTMETYQLLQSKKNLGDLFDHTIYILNGVIAVPPTRYTRLKQGQEIRGQYQIEADLLQRQKIQSIQRISIDGNDFPNDDYIAFPIVA